MSASEHLDEVSTGVFSISETSAAQPSTSAVKTDLRFIKQAHSTVDFVFILLEGSGSILKCSSMNFSFLNAKEPPAGPARGLLLS